MEIFYTFPNTYAAILAEKVLLNAGISVKVRPVPSTISAGCGMCLCLFSELRNLAENEMKKHSATFSAAYLLRDGRFDLLEQD